MKDALAAPLPTLLAELAQAFGEPTALALAKLSGGRRLYVPRTPDPLHPLVKALGTEAARWLGQRFGGEFIDVPLGPTSERARRGASAQAMLAEGRSIAETAQATGLSRRAVADHRRRLRDGARD